MDFLTAKLESSKLEVQSDDGAEVISTSDEKKDSIKSVESSVEKGAVLDLKEIAPKEPLPASIVLTNESKDLDRCADYLRTATELGFDVEGVDLGREGKTSIVQICTKDHVFVFDVMNEGREMISRDCKIVLLLKEILENKNVVKIIHDCKMDSDALYHHFGIELKNIHDTQCWDIVINNSSGANLNNTLLSYGLPPNSDRNKLVYKINPEFWATRPMTEQMKNWAFSDVTSLLLLRDKQMTHASSAKALLASQKSTELAENFPFMIMETYTISRYNMGKLIGSGGCNIQSFHRRHPNTVVQIFRQGILWVYAKDQTALSSAKKALSVYK